MKINLQVLHDAAFGGDEKETVPIERGALRELYREFTSGRGGRRRRPKGALTVGDLMCG
jgi:hypothetical protein